MLFPARRFYGISGPGIFAFVGVVDGGVAAWGKGYMGVMCKNI